MAVAAIAPVARAAAAAAQRYGPAVLASANELIAKATGGRVTQVTQLPKYVGSDAGRMSVAAGALARAGVTPDDIVPERLIGESDQLAQIRATVIAQATTLRAKYDSQSDKTLASTTEGDVIRKRRVAAALKVYGSSETYYLCHPNGGIPREDFAWYEAVIRSR